MNLSYRARRNLRRLGVTALVVVIAAVVLWLCWIIWVGRYIVYTPTGAKLDFSLSRLFPTGEVAAPPTTGETFPVVYKDPGVEETVPVEKDKPISGYYIDFEELKTDIPGLRKKLAALPAGTAVLLDVKNTKGFFHYSTSVGSTNSKDVDTAEMDELISYLTGGSFHVIARLPAFRDWEFGLNNVPCGLPRKGGNGSLWMDDTNCYWLDPTKEGTLNYLTQITIELRSKGFDEVAFTDFRFPDTDKIVFNGDEYQALADAAATLVSTCATDRFCVSFYSDSPTLALPQGNARLYMENVPAADLSLIAQQLETDDPAMHLLFLTTLNDTRYDKYCVLRPLDSAH